MTTGINVRICIRPAIAAEAGKLTEIAFASKRHWQYPEVWFELWTDELTVSGEYIQTHDVFCATAAGATAGWYALSFSETSCELDYLWVLPEKMGCGVGSAMVRHAQRLFSQSHAETMTVIADPHAEGFYLKMGFEKVGMHPSQPKGRRLPVLAIRKSMF